MSTSGFPEEKKIIDNAEDEKKLGKKGAAHYRRSAARIYFMSQDRADLAFAAKETSRSMSSPSEGDQVRLKRVIRYASGARSAINHFKWQDRPSRITTYRFGLGRVCKDQKVDFWRSSDVWYPHDTSLLKHPGQWCSVQRRGRT